jgi:hypothetical protein
MSSTAAGINSAFASNKFFRADSKRVKIGSNINFSQEYVVLKPKGGDVGIVDVLNTMKWKNNGSTDEVPGVWATEYELKFGTTATNIIQLLKQAENAFQVLKNAFVTGDNPNASLDTFLTMYASDRTGFAYNFPYLNTNAGLKKVSNNWSKSNSLLESIGKNPTDAAGGGKGDLIGATVGTVVGLMTPGFGFEEIQSFNETSPQTLTISFPLYNTIDIESAFDNYCFVNLLTFQNLKTRTTMMSYIPPKIYTVDTFSLGGIYMAAAYISDLTIESIGTTRKMDIFKDFGSRDVLIPEAYKVTITFTDLISQSSNIFAATMGGKKVDVVSINSAALDAITTAKNNTIDILNSGVTATERFGQSKFNSDDPEVSPQQANQVPETRTQTRYVTYPVQLTQAEIQAQSPDFPMSTVKNATEAYQVTQVKNSKGEWVDK